MYSVIRSFGLNGLNGFAVAVEADVSGGMPALSIVGLPDSAVRESGDRVHAAARNLGFKWPDRRITVNLAPADVRKTGPVYDLPLLLAVLSSAGQIEPPPEEAAFLGELALDGSLRPVSGVLPMALTAAASGVQALYVPAENAAEAAEACGDTMLVYPAHTALEVVDALRGIRTVFTIHNIEYQGKFGANTVSDLFGLDRGWYDGGTLEMDGCVNLMKGAMLCADAVTTVSPTYARQLCLSAYAQGMESVVQRCGEKFSGIVNGIDTAVFDPATDPVLPAHYSVRNLRGKATCKKDLQQELGLQVQSDVPVISMVSRLVGHKGIDLICESLDNIMRTGCQLVLQGSGEEQYESFFRYAENRYKGRLCAYIGYNEDLAHRIYAGSDLFLMPSRSEPCGLSQMIAMRYGAVPIVRQTGGLADTVRSCQMGQEDGNGFVFANYSAFDMQYVISQAVELYRSDLHGFRRVQRCGMTDDFSWNVSAGAYEALYENITDTSR